MLYSATPVVCDESIRAVWSGIVWIVWHIPVVPCAKFLRTILRSLFGDQHVIADETLCILFIWHNIHHIQYI